jgi:hypothetical protein
VGLLIRVGSFFVWVITKIVIKSHVFFGDASQLLTDLVYVSCPAPRWLPPLFFRLQSIRRGFIHTMTFSTSRLARC